jgi:hypothetical protein
MTLSAKPDSVGEILPVPPFPKEGTSKPPFVKGAAHSAGGFCSVAVGQETFANSIKPVARTLEFAHPRLNQTAGDSYRGSPFFPFVACAMRTNGGGQVLCAQRTLHRECPNVVWFDGATILCVAASILSKWLVCTILVSTPSYKIEVT